MSAPRDFRVPKDVVCEVLDGEAVLLNLRTGRYFALNATGTRMWDALGRFRSCDAALPELIQELAVDGVRLRADLENLAQELLAAGLLELEEA